MIVAEAGGCADHGAGDGNRRLLFEPAIVGRSC
jgi:hypothetical protein